jgi:hypothetical protein
MGFGSQSVNGLPGRDLMGEVQHDYGKSSPWGNALVQSVSPQPISAVMDRQLRLRRGWL